MNEYKWVLKNGQKAKLSFSTNYDNIISKYKGRTCIERALLMDCGIVGRMPAVMRYCFEEKVDLKKREFLRQIPDEGFDDIDRLSLNSYLKIPLKNNSGLVRNAAGNLVLDSSKLLGNGSVSFKPEDVPQFVEGIVIVLDCEGVALAHRKAKQIIKYYHQCLDNGLLRR